jgi:hypothetical protein
MPAAPFVAPISGELDQKLAQVAAAINRKADVTAVPTFSAIMFATSNGETWRFYIDVGGAVRIEQVIP